MSTTTTSAMRQRITKMSSRSAPPAITHAKGSALMGDGTKAVTIPTRSSSIEPARKQVVCCLCGHVETGDGYHPHDAMTEHYRTHARAKACGCVYRPRPVEAQSGLDVCDQHATAYLRERTEWRIANHEARRWSATRPEAQLSLFAGAGA